MRADFFSSPLVALTPQELNLPDARLMLRQERTRAVLRVHGLPHVRKFTTGQFLPHHRTF